MSHTVLEFNHLLQVAHLKQALWNDCSMARTSSAAKTEFWHTGHFGAPPNLGPLFRVGVAAGRRLG